VILIDPEGRRLAGLPPGEWLQELSWGHASGPAASNAEPINGADSDPAAYAVRDFGFIEVSTVRDGVQIRMRPLLVSGQAATQLYFSLADMRPARVVLARFDDDRQQWRHEICGHWRSALERMDALVFANEKLPSYIASELDLAELEAQPEDGLIELHLLWERSNRRLEKGTSDAFAELQLNEQSLTVAAQPGDAALRVVRLGSGLHLYGEDWAGNAAGRDLADQPDGVFAARIGANLRRCMVLDRPLFHRVEATVRRSAKTAVQLSYRRLVLPWHLPDGRRAVTSTVLLEQFIEITG